MTVEINENTRRTVWMALARATADHRRTVSAEDREFYDDLTLRRTAEGHASAQRGRAIAEGLKAGVSVDELVDALVSGDSALDLGEARELIDSERHRETRLAELYGRVLGDMFGEPD